MPVVTATRPALRLPLLPRAYPVAVARGAGPTGTPAPAHVPATVPAVLTGSALWLHIDADPALVIYRGDLTAVPAVGLPLARLVALDTLTRSLDAEAQNSHLRLTLDNGDGYLTDLFTHPPVRWPAVVGHTVDGVVVRRYALRLARPLTVGASINLTLEA